MLSRRIDADKIKGHEKIALLGAVEAGAARAVLLAVLGGAFSEGLDLPGERLRNVLVVSTGLPQPDEKIKAMQI